MCICQNNDLWSGKSLRICDGKNHGKIKVCWQCARELRVAPEGMIGAFSCLQVSVGRQSVCCYCLRRLITDAVDVLTSKS